MAYNNSSNLVHSEKEANEPLSVFAAVNLTNHALSNLPFTILGEVSELNIKSGYKAAYFTIKDERATLPCMMWNNRFKASGIQLSIGSKIIVQGTFNIYAKKGRLSFTVSSIKLEGEGDLRVKIAQLAQKLKVEGLMDQDRKRKLVAFPEVIGLVTSPRGAAVHDVLRTLRRRFPYVKILLAGVPVEGKDAHLNLVEGINCVVANGAQEVLLVRGGGTFEDLLPFNEEVLARCIAACPVPVITGIGHEPDNSIADMVADVRCSTPTAAAEAIAPDTIEIRTILDSNLVRMHRCLGNRLKRSMDRLDSYRTRQVFADPYFLVGDYAQDLDVAQIKLNHVKQNLAEKPRKDLSSLETRFIGALKPLLNDSAYKVDLAQKDLLSTGQSLINTYSKPYESKLSTYQEMLTHSLDSYKNSSALVASRLDDLSPLKVMARGWSITRNNQGSVVKSVKQVKPSDELKISVIDGEIAVAVETVELNTNQVTE